MTLTEQEIQHFHEYGYVVKPGVFNKADLQPLKDAISEIVEAEARSMRAEGLIEKIYGDEGFETRLACLHKDNPEAGERIARAIMGKGGGGFSGPAIFGVLRHPPLVSCVGSLVGPDIIGSSAYRIRIKMPQYHRGEVPWHQDSGYFLSHCDHHLMITCWIPLVDANVENGCLYVLPGAHRTGIIRHYTSGHAGYLEIPDDELPAGRPTPVEMKEGGCLFMTNLTPHSSYSNTSNIVRWSIDLRYQAMDSPNNVDEDPASYTPEREPVTMACYPSEADFVIQDTAHPEREIRTPAQFHEVRDRYENARPYNPGRGWTPLGERKK